MLSVVAATFHKRRDAHEIWCDAETQLADLRRVHSFLATCMVSVIEEVAREKPKPCISPQVERRTQQACIDVSKLFVEGVPIHPMFARSEFVERLCSWFTSLRWAPGFVPVGRGISFAELALSFVV